MDIVIEYIGRAFTVLFVDFQIPFLGISLGLFIFGLTMIHFLIDLFLPFLRRDVSDKAKATYEYAKYKARGNKD